MTYSEKLKDPRWQKMRFVILTRDNWACCKCGRTDLSLQVHHKRYKKFAEPWDYKPIDLETLCYRCHEKEHLPPPIEIVNRVIGKLVDRDEPEVITVINLQITELQEKLKEDVPEDTEIDILKNIMFLQNKKKELLQL